jgi:hypothetical protein
MMAGQRMRKCAPKCEKTLVTAGGQPPTSAQYERHSRCLRDCMSWGAAGLHGCPGRGEPGRGGGGGGAAGGAGRSPVRRDR